VCGTRCSGDSCTLDRVQRAGIGVAVLLDAALEQDDKRGLTSRRRPEKQEQPASDLGSGARGLEIVDEPLEGLVDAEQFVLEKRTAEATLVVRVALRADHVPDILVAAAADALRIRGYDRFEEFAKRAGPVGGTMILAEFVQGTEKGLLALCAVLEGMDRHLATSCAEACGLL
jgi:hypothetical protein